MNTGGGLSISSGKVVRRMGKPSGGVVTGSPQRCNQSTTISSTSRMPSRPPPAARRIRAGRTRRSMGLPLYFGSVDVDVDVGADAAARLVVGIEDVPLG